jgi:hypothetical protein
MQVGKLTASCPSSVHRTLAAPCSDQGKLLALLCAGAVLAALAVWLVYRRRQRRHKQDTEQQDKGQYPPALEYSFTRSNTAIMGAPGASVTGHDSASEVHSTHKSQGGRKR